MQGATDFRDLRAVRSMQLLCNGYLDVVGLQFGPAACSPSSTGCVKSCFGSLGDDVVLKLRQHRNKLKKQDACRCARIDIFCQRHQMDVAFFQSFQRFDELLQGPSQSIQFPHNQRISLVQILHGREKCLTVKADSGLLISEDSHNPSVFQGI